MLTCYKTRCTRTTIFITAISEWLSLLLMLETSVLFVNNYFTNTRKNQKWRFDIGQRVKISKRKQAFEKGYLPGWLQEIFIIPKRFPTTPVTYEIKDASDEETKGRFYEPELPLIIKEDNVYDVEKVLKTRRRNGKIEYYANWKGYPDKFYSWIDSCSLVSANVGNSAG